MALWVDVHRPRDFASLSCHPDTTKLLQKLVELREIPHILFYGPEGGGKRTRALALLSHLYGPSVEKIKIEKKIVKSKSSSAAAEIYIITSNHHIEVTPSDVGPFKDTLVVQQLIKEIASSPPVNVGNKNDTVPFKTVLLNNVDLLSMNAQAGLRRTMEKYVASCRLIMTCDNLSKIMSPIRSRCLCLRVPRPPIAEVVNVLKEVSQRENVPMVEDRLESIARDCGRDLRKAILRLEVLSDQRAVEDDSKGDAWLEWIQAIARKTMAYSKPADILSIRSDLYDLLTNMTPPNVILQGLLNELIPKVSPVLRVPIIKQAALLDSRMAKGSKPIIHLEAFIVHVMALRQREAMNK